MIKYIRGGHVLCIFITQQITYTARNKLISCVVIHVNVYNKCVLIVSYQGKIFIFLLVFQIRITESHIICIYLVQCHIDIQLYNFQCSNNQPKKQIINKYLKT
jgi:hypothetical protein